MTRPAYHHCTAVDQRSNKMYLIGGMNFNTKRMNTETQVFDMTTRTFSTIINQLSEGRANHACTIPEEGGVLVAAGGYKQGWEVTLSVEILDLTTLTWSNAKIMPSGSDGKAWEGGQNVFTWEAEKLYQFELKSNEWLELDEAPFDLSKMQIYFLPIYNNTHSTCPLV